MAQQLINVGAAANDNTGDTLRSAFIKTNDNFSEIYGGLSFSSTNVTLSGELRGPATLIIDPAAVGDNTGTVVIKGNLQVDGTTTTINSTTTTIDDPIFTLGGDSAPTIDDNKDRGVEFRWHNGSTAKLGFFGFDDSTGYFTFIPDASNASEVFSGSAGDIQAANFRGNLVGNADTVTNGVYTTGSYANPNWITSLSETKVLPSQTGNNNKYLTTNGTSTSWADITLPSGQTAGSATAGYLQYAGTTKTSGQFDGGTTNPSNTTRLNYDGNFYATNFYGNGSNLTSLSATNLSSGTVPGDRGVTAGSASSSFVEYNGTTKTTGQFDGGTVDPSSTTRLNYDGYLYATRFYGDGSQLTGISTGATITDDTSTNGTRYLLFDDVTSGAATSVGVSSTKLTFNPSTGLLTLGSGIKLSTNADMVSATVTTTSTTATALATFATASYGSAKVLIQATQGVNRQVTELFVVHDGTTAYANEYGTQFTSSRLFNVEVDISAGNARVLVTTTSATSTVYKTQYTLITA